MNSRGEIMAVLAAGTGTAVRLFLATLAALSAYMGVGIADVTPERPITLSARTLPAETPTAVRSSWSAAERTLRLGHPPGHADPPGHRQRLVVVLGRLR
ncbi:hypothetical protein Aple_035370 [Acrocarpospora pleiomorpha]|uniref:Uncharacterized protein n=1 Tax=Acrocarpospora pleiomorpha TaxID=90975 RepID=A0A5M3XLW5_9ACTN|nr:hypothetical protein Aple_035370 [Acrocarpospora pleiomorpha]